MAAAGLILPGLGNSGADHWQSRWERAVLVAPPNADRPDFSREARGFSPVPRTALRFPGIVVASTDSVFGDWPEGMALFRQLAA